MILIVFSYSLFIKSAIPTSQHRIGKPINVTAILSSHLQHLVLLINRYLQLHPVCAEKLFLFLISSEIPLFRQLLEPGSQAILKLLVNLI